MKILSTNASDLQKPKKYKILKNGEKVGVEQKFQNVTNEAARYSSVNIRTYFKREVSLNRILSLVSIFRVHYYIRVNGKVEVKVVKVSLSLCIPTYNPFSFSFIQLKVGILQADLRTFVSRNKFMWGNIDFFLFLSFLHVLSIVISA